MKDPADIVGRSECNLDGIDLLLDGEVPDRRESFFFRHLSECDDCRGYFSAVLQFRCVAHEEHLSVPHAADDALLARLGDARRSDTRAARLHAREPLWKAKATVSVRGLLVAFGIILISAAYLVDRLEPSPAYVTFEQERVRFDRPVADPSPHVFVFYPGLTVEAERDAS